ncbi:hypothetical protein MTO96_008507 [Rhipicephalus appendiculatus]
MRLRPSSRSILRKRRHRFRRVEQGGAGKSRISVLLCVSIDEEVLQNVAVENERQLSILVRNLVRPLRSKKYDGICFRLSVMPTEGRSFFLKTLRTVTERLSENNSTMSLLLPYGPPRRTLRQEIPRLVAALGRRHAIFFYPTPALFRNKAKWPSPKDIAFLSPKTSANVCYLLPASAYAVALQGDL